jgi:hypothetical protein
LRLIDKATNSSHTKKPIILNRSILLKLTVKRHCTLYLPEENEAAGGAPNSQHLFGEAIDIKPYGSTTYDMLALYIQNYSQYSHMFDQLILYPTFIHISFGERNRLQLIDKRK